MFGLFLKKPCSQNANVAIIVHTTCNIGQESYGLFLWSFVIFESLTLYTTIQMFVFRFDVFLLLTKGAFIWLKIILICWFAA